MPIIRSTQKNRIFHEPKQNTTFRAKAFRQEVSGGSQGFRSKHRVLFISFQVAPAMFLCVLAHYRHLQRQFEIHGHLSGQCRTDICFPVKISIHSKEKYFIAVVTKCVVVLTLLGPIAGSIIGGRAHVHIFVFCTINFCEMNMTPPPIFCGPDFGLRIAEIILPAKLSILSKIHPLCGKFTITAIMLCYYGYGRVIIWYVSQTLYFLILMLILSPRIYARIYV